MVRKFPAGAFSFEIEDDEIRLVYNNKVVDRRPIPLLPDELPIVRTTSSLGKWSSAWYHLLAFDPERAEELRTIATQEGPGRP